MTVPSRPPSDTRRQLDQLDIVLLWLDELTVKDGRGNAGRLGVAAAHLQHAIDLIEEHSALFPA